MGSQLDNTPNDNHITAEIGGLPWEWDLSKGSLRHCGMPAVALWIDHSVGRMLHPLRDEIGPALSDLLIASSGHEGAHADYQAIVSQHGSSFPDGFSGWAKAVASSGWGVFSLLDYDENRCSARVRVDQPWELELAVGLPATCPFIQGKLIGLFSLAFQAGCWVDPVGGAAGDEGFVEFEVSLSSRTIADEIESLRCARMQQAELALTREVNLQTRALKSAEESQRSILNSLSDLVVTLNAEGLIERYILPTTGRAGFPTEEQAVGYPIDQVFGADFSHLKTRLMPYPKHQLTVSCECQVGGEIRHFDTRVSLRKDAQDIVEGFTLVIRDVTVQRQLEEELRTRQSLQNLEQLANGIAHDFNNVMHTVLSAAELIKLKQNDGAAPLADTIIQATGSAAGLIKRMQHLMVRQPRERNQVSLHGIIEQTVQLFRQQLDESVSVSATLDARHFILRADDSQLEHMLLNLCLNAKNSLQQGGQIGILTRDSTKEDTLLTPVVGALKADDSYVVLTVEDSGRGMGPETLARIFQPFFTTASEQGHTGLGLLGVEAAVIAHGGAICVESKAGKGSRFLIYLPIDQNLVEVAIHKADATRN